MCHGHDPVGGKEFVIAAWAALLDVIEKSFPVKHEIPLAFHGHEHGGRSGIRLSIGAGGYVMLQQLDQRMGFHGHGLFTHVLFAHMLVAHARHVRPSLLGVAGLMLSGDIHFGLNILCHGRGDLHSCCRK